MARGSEAKEKIANQILATFDGAFRYDKEIRVPVTENSEVVQVKITLTAAKTNVAAGGDVAMPAVSRDAPQPAPANLKITEKERKEVNDLVAILGL